MVSLNEKPMGVRSKVRLEDMLSDDLLGNRLLQKVSLRTTSTPGYNLDEITHAEQLAYVLRTNVAVNDRDSIAIRANHQISCDVALLQSVHSELEKANDILLGTSKTYEKRVEVDGKMQVKKYTLPQRYDQRLKQLQEHMVNVSQKYNARQMELFSREISTLVSTFATYATIQRENKLDLMKRKLQQEYDARVYTTVEPQEAKDWFVDAQRKVERQYSNKTQKLQNLIDSIHNFVPKQTAVESYVRPVTNRVDQEPNMSITTFPPRNNTLNQTPAISKNEEDVPVLRAAYEKKPLQSVSGWYQSGISRVFQSVTNGLNKLATFADNYLPIPKNSVTSYFIF